jgi:molybdate transport system ATP-binding protein
MISIAIQKKLKTYKGQQQLTVDREFTTGSVTKISGPSGVGSLNGER